MFGRSGVPKPASYPRNTTTPIPAPTPVKPPYNPYAIPQVPSTYGPPVVSPPPTPTRTPYAQTNIPTPPRITTPAVKMEETNATGGDIVVPPTPVGGADAMRVISGVRERLNSHVDKLRQDHLSGLEWAMNELDNFRQLYETAIAQFQEEIAKLKKEIDAKAEEVKAKEAEIAKLGVEKEVAVKEAAVCSLWCWC
jgi:hypothetical protein